jgi:hypothetical protein
MNADIYGNKLQVGDEVVVFFEDIVPTDINVAIRLGVLKFIDENKRTARVRYRDSSCDLAVDKKCVVLASAPEVSLLLLQL